MFNSCVKYKRAKRRLSILSIEPCPNRLLNTRTIRSRLREFLESNSFKERNLLAYKVELNASKRRLIVK